MTGSSFAGQILWLVVWMVYWNAYSVAFLRFAARYAPFELFGSFMGVLSSVMVLPQVALATPLSVWMGKMYPVPGDLRRYTVMFTVLNGVAAAATIAMLAWWFPQNPRNLGMLSC